jgi:hypothetical protein
MSLLPETINWQDEKEKYIRFIIKIDKSTYRLVDEESNIVLGKRVSFTRKRGLVYSLSPSPSAGETCETIQINKNRDKYEIEAPASEQKFFRKILIPDK